MPDSPTFQFIPMAKRDGLSPAADEVLLQPSKDSRAALAEDQLRRVRARPLDPLRVIYLSSDPTLDDLLAAELLRRAAAGEAPPAGLDAFAQYTALVRDGFRADGVPFAKSLHGLYCALRSDCPDLTDGPTRDRFLARWARIAEVVWQAAGRGADPFKEELFDGAEFARERAMLAADREVYHSDLTRGRRLRGSIPGGPRDVPILVLDRPRSRLFKFWSRSHSADRPEEYAVLLAVSWGDGKWVISTDPAQNLNLQPLAERLTADERAADAGAGPWFDGARFQHSLIGAPDAGTRLPQERVIQVLTRWTAARPVGARAGSSHRLMAAGVAGVLLVAGVLAGVWLRPGRSGGGGGSAGGSAGGGTGTVPEPGPVISRGRRITPDQRQQVVEQYKTFDSHALLMCVSEAQGSDYVELPATCKDVGRLLRVLVERYEYPLQNIHVLADNTRDVLDAAQLSALSGRQIPEPTFANFTKTVTRLSEVMRKRGQTRSRFLFYFAGHGDVFPGNKEQLGYLIFSGFDPENPNSTGYEMGELERLFKRHLNNSHRLLVVDSCFSGATITQRSGEKPSANLYEKWGKEARVILTASSDKQQASEIRGSSVLMATLLEGVGPELAADRADEKGQKDGIVTDEELAIYLKENVRRKCPTEEDDASEAARACRSTTPQYVRLVPTGDEVGQFLFVPKETPK